MHSLLRSPVLWFVFLGGISASAQESSAELFSDPQDLETWNWLLERAGKSEHIERNAKGELLWIGFEGETKYTASIQLDPQGRVCRATFNQAAFTDEELHKLAGFRHLIRLTAWHNFDRNLKASETNPLSGAGLVAFKEGALESVNFGGSMFDDAGVAAATQVPTLKELIIYHTRVTDAGMAALAGDEHIEYLRLGPQFSMKITNAALPHLAIMKALRHLEINETMLSWKGLEHLLPLKGQLNELTFKKTQISAEDLKRLKAALPDVEISHTPPAPEELEKMQRILARQASH